MSKALHTDWTSVPDLGQVPDRVIATRLGCCVSTVVKARQARGIPACRPPGARPGAGRKQDSSGPRELRSVSLTPAEWERVDALTKRMKFANRSELFRTALAMLEESYRVGRDSSNKYLTSRPTP